MICRRKPSDDESITCKTCATPWHVTCLSVRPETLADALQWQVADALQWECPDCSPAVGERDPPEVSETAVAAGGSEGSGDLIAAIRAIESDGSLTEQEKAKRRQELLSGTVRSGSPEEGSPNKRKNGGRDVLDILDGSLNCSVCMQLLERPVTTPCGHNFCLKCFEKWIGQGKRTCANCRNEIPRKVASQPRINSALVVAIRMAKMSKSVTSVGTSKVYHFVHNQNRPDKAYTTERAKKAGKANACSGKIFVTVPPDHFGPILAENDPERNQGVLVGESWEDRLECRQWGAHLPHVAGIAGQSEVGAQSVALSGGYEDDEDHGEWFLYTGSGGRDLSGNKRTNKEQSFDQKFEKSNEALKVSCLKGYPVRVVRSHKEKRSSYAPETGVRYDGIYRIEKCWRKVGIQGFRVCRYLFVRCDNDPAPWTSDDHGDRPRPLPVIKELKNATDTSERKGTPSWDYDETEGRWMWKKPPPASRKQGDGGGTVVRKIQRHKQILSAKERLLNEFRCLMCRNVMVLPLTTPCAHNFCKSCLEGAFSGQTFVRQRTCEGRRTLRAQKNVMKCPSCPNDISDFLQNPQVNRELMDVIVSLQRRTVESGEDAEETSEGTDGMDEKPDAITGDKEIGESCEIQEDSEETDGMNEKQDSEETDGMDEKPDAVAADKETGDESCEIQDAYQKDVSDPLVETKPEKGNKQKKVLPRKSDSVNGNAEVKSDTLNADAEVNAVKGGAPENNELQTSPVDSTPKRNYKRRKPNGVSNSPASTLGYGVKTRSMKAKMAAAAPNDLPSITIQVQSDDDFE